MAKYNERGYRIPKERLSCKFSQHWMEDLAGDGGPRCPMFECIYEGNILIPDEMVCEENSKCPAYQPIETTICPKHDIEYIDYCELCFSESEDW